MRVNHRLAARNVADEQNRKDAKQKKSGAEALRAKITPSVNEVNSDATRKNSPAAAVDPLPIDERSKTERKHPGQTQRPPLGFVVNSAATHATT